MSERRETTLKASRARGVAGDEARDLPLPEVLAHRRHHHDDRGEGIRRASAPTPRRPRRAPSRTCRSVSLAARSRPGSGRTSPNSTRAVAVQVGRRPRAAELLGKRPPERALGEVEEVPRLLEHGAVRERQVEGDGALGILGRARAGVEDDVVLGERRRSRRRCPRPARSTGCPRSRRPSSARRSGSTSSARARPERVEVEVLRRGELVVLRRQLVELLGEAGEPVGVVAEEALDAGELAPATVAASVWWSCLSSTGSSPPQAATANARARAIGNRAPTRRSVDSGPNRGRGPSAKPASFVGSGWIVRRTLQSLSGARRMELFLAGALRP